MEVMRDPVLLPTGQTYERRAIQAWWALTSCCTLSPSMRYRTTRTTLRRFGHRRPVNTVNPLTFEATP
jgi:hypothetical protein